MSISESSKDQASTANLLDQLADEFVGRLRQGERPSVEEYADRHPKLADEIRELFPTLALVENLKPATPTGDSRPGVNASDSLPPQEIMGDFRIIREVGRGGMGVVYEAEQVSLGRHVALKVLPTRFWTSDLQRSRFQREARAAARLHHTNIVPVFGVGEHEGVHYYVMQYIRGQGLDDVLVELKRLRAGPERAPSAATTAFRATDEFPLKRTREPASALALSRALMSGEFAANQIAGEPTQVIATTTRPAAKIGKAPGSEGEVRSPSGVSQLLESGVNAGGCGDEQYWKSVARIGHQVALALEYAHQQGIVHRDVKPANLLLDLQGRVWVTDFGLAKDQDQQDLTHTGDVVGTLRYMAPEQLRGAGDARSDIYALGMTLYELLTTSPAFAATERGELIQAVLKSQPRRLRSLDRNIPRDLETIVHKAIDSDPSQRYATAEAFAEDLHRFELGEPVRARRQGVTERLVRWSRRNPALASLTTAVLLLMAAVAGVLVSSAHDSEGQRRVLETQNRVLVEAQRQSLIQLATSFLQEARANRLSRRIGQRFNSLEKLRNSAALARELMLDSEFMDELRAEAISVSALCDLRPAVAHPCGETIVPGVTLDDDFVRGVFRYPDGRVVVKRLADNKWHCTIPGTGYDGAIQISPNGKYLLLFDDKAVPSVWNLETSPPSRVLTTSCRNLILAISPDSRYLGILTEETTFCLFELATGQLVAKHKLRSTPNAVAFHPRQPWVAIAYGNSVEVVEQTTGARQASSRFSASVSYLAWHPEATCLAACFDSSRSVEIWSFPADRVVQELGRLSRGTTASFDPSGEFLLTAGWDHVTRLHHWRSGEMLLSTENPIGIVKFSRDGKHVGPMLQDGKVGYWEFYSAPEHRILAREAALGQDTFYRLFSDPDGRFLFTGTDQGVAVWDLQRGKELGYLPSQHFPLLDEQGLLSVGTKIWRWPLTARHGHPQSWQLGPPQPVAAGQGQIAASRDGRIIVEARGDGAVILRPGKSPESSTIGPHADCRYVAVSPDGKWAATGSHYYTGVKIWNAATGEKVTELLKEEAWIRPAFSPNGEWLLTNQSNSHVTRLWKVGSWQEGPDLGDGGFGSRFHPNGRLIAVGTLHGVRLVSAQSGREITRFQAPFFDRPEICCFSPDGRYLFAASDIGHRVHRWNLQRLRQVLEDLGIDPGFGDDLPPNSEPSEPLTLQIAWGRIGVERVVQQANQLLQQKKYDDAIAVTTDALTTTPEEAELYCLRGRARAGKNDYLAAVDDYARAIELRNDLEDAYHNRGHAHGSLRKYREALADFEKATQLKSGDPHLLHMLGLYRRQVGDFPGAVDAWQRSLAQQSAAALQLELARLLLLAPAPIRGPQEAAQLLERAAQTPPVPADLTGALGVAAYRLDRYDEAVARLQSAASTQQDRFPLTHRFFLAMALHRRNSHDQATECYRQALSRYSQQKTLSPGEQTLLDLVHAEAKTLFESPLADPASK